jgi:hypothetical protein
MSLTLPNFHQVIHQLKTTFMRFGFTMLCVVIVAILTFYENHNIKLFSQDVTLKILLSAIYSGFVFTNLSLYGQSKGWSINRLVVASVAAWAVVTCLVWFVFEPGSFPTHLLFTLFCVFLLMAAPYINRASDNDSIWYFNYQTGVALFFGGVSSLILGIGGTLILQSIGYLFDVKIDHDFVVDVWISAGILFLPIYVLAHIAVTFDVTRQISDFPKGVKFIATYILLPLMAIYLVILYAYFLKITLNQQLPRGDLSLMILIFGVIGVATKLLIYPIRHNGGWLLKLFDNYYHHTLIIPIIVLFFAIGVRVEAFGVTGPRYVVILLAVWLGIVALMSLRYKDNFSIKFAPLVLAALAFMATFGPWGAQQMSLTSQLGRFEALLNKHQLLVDGVAVKAKQALSLDERKALSSATDYFMKNDSRFAAIEPWFMALKANSALISPEKRLGGSSALLGLMGIEYANKWQNPYDAFEFSWEVENANASFDVSKFDYFIPYNVNRYTQVESKTTTEFIDDGQQQTLIADFVDEQLVVSVSGSQSVTFDLQAVTDALYKAGRPYDPSLYHLAKDSDDGKLKAGVVIQRIYANVSADKQAKIYTLRLMLMWRVDESL